MVYNGLCLFNFLQRSLVYQIRTFVLSNVNLKLFISISKVVTLSLQGIITTRYRIVCIRWRSLLNPERQVQRPLQFIKFGPCAACKDERIRILGVQFLNICMFRVDDTPVLKYTRSRFSPRVVQACMFKTFNRMSKGTIQSIIITAVRNKWNHCRLRNFWTSRIIVFRLLSLIIRYNSYFIPAIGIFVKILLFSKV